MQNKNVLTARLMSLVMLCALSGVVGAQTIRVNAGGPTYTDTASNVWSADTGSNTGNVSNWGTPSIAGTSDPTLYRTERWDPPAAPEMAYSFNVPNGTYTVRLHFAENWSGAFAVGLRVFDVNIQGSLVFDNLDVFAQAGARTVLIKTATATVTNGTLAIGFVHQVDDPFIDAIEIIPATDTTAPSVPGTVTATAASSSQINLSWGAATDNVGVTGYLVERCQGAGCSNFAQITMTPGTTYNDPGLAAATSYSYRVRARDAADNRGGYSSTASATTSSAPPPTPGEVNYEYDDAGRLRRVILPDTTQQTYKLDAAGNRVDVQTVVGGGRLNLAVATASVSEGTSPFTINVTRSGNTTNAITVNYATASGSATSGTDFTAASGTLNWASGDGAPKAISVPITNDATFEAAETFTITLSAPGGGALLGSVTQSTVTINDNDSVSFSIAAVTVGESAGSASITVTKNGASALTHAVNYATSNGSAVAGSDYTSTSGTLTFAPGDSTKTFSVAIADDSVYEGNEAVNLSLSSPTNGATLGTSAATLTIQDNDAGPVFSMPVFSLVGEATPTVSVTVTKSGATALTHTVNYATAFPNFPDSNATAGSDYVATSGTLSFAPGETSKSIVISILDDTIYEGNESFSLSLSAATNGASIDPANSGGVVTISEDEPVPPLSTLQFASSSASTTEGSGAYSLTVTRTGSSFGAASVVCTSSNGTASAGSDYAAISQTLTWASGDAASKSCSTTILEDTTFEGSETFAATLSGVAGATLGTPTSTIVTIADNDPAPPTVTTPQNLRKSPTTGTGSTYTILWDASTGAVGYYILEESAGGGFVPFPQINHPTTSQGFSNKSCGDYTYQVKACTAGGTCSGYSNQITKRVCNN